MSSKKFRNDTGLTQSQLADWLGISRDLLAQYELNRWEIPANALVRLSKLRHLLSEQPESLPATEPPISFPKKEKQTRTKIRRLEFEISQLHFQMEQLEYKMAVWKKALTLCRQLAANPPFEDEIFKMSLDIFHRKTWISWQENGPGQKKILEFYISQKTTEKQFLEQLANEYLTGELG